LKHGLGQVVFLFPGSQVGDADEAVVFNRPELQRRRAALPDQRVQPDLFGGFVPAAASAARRSSVMIWAALGGLIFCMGVFFARKSRSKIEALVLPLVALALMTALVANGFKQQDVMVSRVVMERCSADGAAVVREEFVFLEAFRREVTVTARGPQNGTLAPRFDDLDDLRKARLERSVLGGMMTLDKIGVAPNQPAMLVANRLKNEQASAGKSVDQVIRVGAAKIGLRIPADALVAMDARRVIWVRAGGEVFILKKVAGDDTYESEAYSIRSLEIDFAERADERLAKARAKAVSWAVDDAVAQGGNVVIFWSDAAQIREPMIVISGASMTVGNEFWVRMVEVKKGE